MNGSANCQSRNIGTGLDHCSERVIRLWYRGCHHAAVEEYSVAREAKLCGGPDEGIEEERIGVSDGEEELTSVENGTSGASQGEELSEEGSAAMRAGDNEVCVDLLEGFETCASSEQHLVGWRVR